MLTRLQLIAQLSLVFVAYPVFAQSDGLLPPPASLFTWDSARMKPASTVPIKYHQFVLLKDDTGIIAIHVMPDPRFGWDGINYRWYRSKNGADEFFRPSPELSDSSRNDQIETGSGSTDERNGGSGYIKVGSLTIEWSKANQEKGWLYLHHLDDSVQYYPKQFDRIQDFSGKLNPELWETVEQLKSMQRKDGKHRVKLEDGDLMINGIIVRGNNR